MRIPCSFLLYFVIFSFSIGQQSPDYLKFIGAINEDTIQNLITDLSSRKFGGRQAGTAYEKKAAGWIKHKMIISGIKGGFSTGSDPYIQEFRFLRHRPEKVFLISGLDTLRQGRDFYISPLRQANDSFRILYGGTVSEKELETVDVKGKIVVVSDKVPGRHEPGDAETETLEEVITRLERLKAAGICITYRDELFRYIPRMDVYDDIRNTYMLPEANPAQVDSFIYILTRDRLINKFFGKQVQAGGKLPMRSGSMLIPGKSAKNWYLDASIKKDTLWSENVVGLIEGSQLKDEVIVISAHYDHLGIKGNNYFPGADDNASGVAAMLSIARVFKQAVEQGYKPVRTIVFVAFSAEELGEIGSAWYARNPIGKTVLNLNMDMVGRTDEFHDPSDPYVYYLTGKNQFRSYDELIKGLGGIYAPSLQLDNRLNVHDFLDYYHRSDQLSFAVDSIPFVVFTTGEHADYHTPSDTSEKVEVSKVTLIARVVGAFAWKFAFESIEPASPYPAR
jgi:hypothetical protein